MKFGYLNVHGLNGGTDSRAVDALMDIHSLELLIISETWQRPGERLYFTHHHASIHALPAKGAGGRHSGGVALLYRNPDAWKPHSRHNGEWGGMLSGRYGTLNINAVYSLVVTLGMAEWKICSYR